MRFFIFITSCFLATASTYGQEEAAENNGLLLTQARTALLLKQKDRSIKAVTVNVNATDVGGSRTRLSMISNSGRRMRTSLLEVEKFMLLRHKGKKYKPGVLEISLQTRLRVLDDSAASAVVMCLAESLVTDEKIDPGVGILGEMSVTGSIHKSPDALAKLECLAESGCQYVCLPLEDTKIVDDYYLLYGVKGILDMQLITCSSFDEIWAVARAKRSPEAKAAFEAFAMIQGALKRNPRHLGNAKVLQKLNEIVKLLPTHASAKLLIKHATGEKAKFLTSGTSRQVIGRVDKAFCRFMRQDNRDFKKDPIWISIAELSRLRGRLARETRDYLDGLQAVATFVQRNNERETMPDSYIKEFRRILNVLAAERKKMLPSLKVEHVDEFSLNKRR